MAKPKVISIANKKSGVDKSTTTYNLGAGRSPQEKLPAFQKCVLRTLWLPVKPDHQYESCLLGEPKNECKAVLRCLLR